MTDTAAPVLSEEEKQKELEGRIESFNKELIPLLGKYELGLGASAFLTPEGMVSSRPIVFDMRGKEVPAQPPADAPAADAPAAEPVATAA
jgi:hypothetical protein